MKGQSGLTLVELMVSLAIVLLVIAAATAAYIRIMRTYSTQGALSQNFMQNLTGFELLRYDIEMAGFGLPQYITGISYAEALAQGDYTSNAPPYDPAVLNEASASLNNANGPPHPFVLSTTTQTTLWGKPEVLAIKSSLADINSASSHFALVSDGQEPIATLVSGDHYIELDNTGALVPNPSTDSWDDTFNPTSLPTTNGQVYYLYGLSTGATTRMPFNRVDYYLDNTNVPKYCDSGTFVLERGVISQTTGMLVSSPLINCVEDFQVAFGIDPTGDATQALKWQTDLNQENIVGGQGAGYPMTAAQMRQYLREVKVYVIYQEGHGKVSPTSGYRFSGSLILGKDLSPNPFSVNTFTPTGVNAQYRWKLLEIDVKPMNMLSHW